jgi:hypothetical protein
MSVFSFMKKKEDEKKQSEPLKNPFTAPTGETIIEEVGKPFDKPSSESIPPLPKDPFDLVEEVPFKPKSDSIKELDEVYNLLEGISTQLKFAADKLRDVSDRMKR